MKYQSSSSNETEQMEMWREMLIYGFATLEGRENVRLEKIDK